MKKLIVITGPTASGKTDLSIRVAKHFNTCIISADSRQFYKKMNIGTAKPDAAQLAEVPHFFIDFLEPGEEYNIGKFETDVLALLEDLFKKHDHVILCGGSGLYIKTITEGMDELPEGDKELRTKLTDEWDKNGRETLLGQLKQLDPVYYEAVDQMNKHRVIRALEVSLITGKPFSSFRTQKKKERPFESLYFSIVIPRDELYERIDRRVNRMIEEGLVEEARSLLPYRSFNALQTVGYRELFDHFDGKYDLNTAIAMIKQNTRNYAKRQMTWIRKVADVHQIGPEDDDKIISIVS